MGIWWWWVFSLVKRKWKCNFTAAKGNEPKQEPIPLKWTECRRCFQLMHELRWSSNSLFSRRRGWRETSLDVCTEESRDKKNVYSSSFLGVLSKDSTPVGRYTHSIASIEIWNPGEISQNFTALWIRLPLQIRYCEQHLRCTDKEAKSLSTSGLYFFIWLTIENGKR